MKTGDGQIDLDEDPVLVSVGEVAKQSEFMYVARPELLRRWVEAGNRLIPLDDCLVSRRNLPNPAFFLAPLGEVGGSVLDGELNRSGVERVLVCVVAGQLPRKVVQRRAEIVDDFAYDDARSLLKRGEVGHGLQAEDVVSGLRVRIGSHGGPVSLVLKEFPNLLIKGIAEFFGPIDLRPAAFERWLVHGVYSGRGRQEAEEEAEEAEGPRDTRARARRLAARPQEGGEALNSTQPPAEVASRTAWR